MVFVTNNGRTIEQAFSHILREIEKDLTTKAGKIFSTHMTPEGKRHVTEIYPGSKHYSPNKVNELPYTGTEGGTKFDIPGITRGYHDLDIRPHGHRFLAIPAHKSAYGKSPREFSDLTYVSTNKGAGFVRYTNNNPENLIWMYSLVNHVHQKQDTKLAPKDERMYTSVMKPLAEVIRQSAMNSIRTA